MKRLIAVVVLVACDKDPKPESKPETPPPPAGGSPMLVNGNAIVPRTMLAATHGGEAIEIAMTSVAGRTCAELFDRTGVSLEGDEVLVQLTIGQPLERDAKWQVLRSSWPGGVAGKSEGTTVLDVPAKLATTGGSLRVKYGAKFQVGAASPKSDFAIDAQLAVKPCGDFPLDPSLKVQAPIEIVGRTLAIRTVLAMPTPSGAEVHLSTGTRTCPNHGGYSSTADLDLGFYIDNGRIRNFTTSGDLVPIQNNVNGADYRVTPSSAWTGDGPLTIQIDSGTDTSMAPVTIHGAYVAQRCPPDP